MIRFDLELDMLEGTLAVKDLPDAWRARYSRTRRRAARRQDGVLQDVHWFGGIVGGAFQGYTLGNILSAQLFAAAVKARTRRFPATWRRGAFAPLHDWLKENVYQHGAKFTTSELLQRVTGGPMSIEPYLRYLRNKYGELYSLDAKAVAAPAR